MKKQFHPFVFALFPILALYVYNIDKAQVFLMARPVLVTLAAISLLFLLAKALIHDWNKAAFLVSLFVILFFSYGHVSSSSQRGLVFFVFILFFLIAAFLLITSKKNFAVATMVCNVVGLVLVGSSIAQASFYEISVPRVADGILEETVFEHRTDLTERQELPDVYYIVLDAHARGDILKEMYHYDNTWFIDKLRSEGFYVADRSTSNYTQTYLSISSELNFRYINYLADVMGSDSSDRKPFNELLDHNAVMAFLRERGYQFVTFASGWTGIDGLSSADIHMHGNIDLGEFENILLQTTPLVLLFGDEAQYELHRNKILYTLEHLPEVAQFDAPTFTYAHLMVPHPPFVFDGEGNKIQHDIPFSLADSTWKLFEGRTAEEYIELYRAQVAYTDQRVLNMVREILARSPKPPIIILQSDHGPGAFLEWENPTDIALHERFSILNAYYFPDKEAYESLYDSITPVNSFRAVFNEYFDTDYELLEDKNYFSSFHTPYQFLDVTASLGRSPNLDRN